MSSTTSPADAARQELTGFEGTLIGPDDSGYDEARVLYNGMIDKRPALIARCAAPTTWPRHSPSPASTTCRWPSAAAPTTAPAWAAWTTAW